MSRKSFIYLALFALIGIIAIITVVASQHDFSQEENELSCDSIGSLSGNTEVSLEEENTIDRISVEDINDVLDNFSDGLICVRNNEGKCGFIDKERNIRIPFIFENALGFSEGLAAVKNSKGEWGYINKDGEMVIAYKQYKWVDKFYNGRAVFEATNGFGVIDNKGKTIIPPSFDWVPFGCGHYHEGILELLKKDQWKVACYDINGVLIIPPSYYIIGDFNQGLAAVNLGNGFGFIDKNGNIKLDGYDMTSPFYERLALVLKDKQEMFIDKTGAVQFVVPENMHCSDRFSEGLVHATYTDKETIYEHVYLNKKGEVSLRFKYDNEDSFKSDSYFAFHDGMARVFIKNYWGYINTSGELKIYKLFDFAYDFNDGYALVKKSGKHILIDKNGNNFFR